MFDRIAHRRRAMIAHYLHTPDHALRKRFIGDLLDDQRADVFCRFWMIDRIFGLVRLGQGRMAIALVCDSST